MQTRVSICSVRFVLVCMDGQVFILPCGIEKFGQDFLENFFSLKEMISGVSELFLQSKNMEPYVIEQKHCGLVFEKGSAVFEVTVLKEMRLVFVPCDH